MFENKTNGIFALLEDEGKLRKNSNENFTNRISEISKNHIALTSTLNGFIIKHYARNVEYSTVSEYFILLKKQL